MKKGETQVGVLIIFSVTIIIALGFLGLISFYYQKNVSQKKYISILGNIYSNKDEIKAIGLCSGADSINIKYNFKKDNYKLQCDVELGEEINKIIQIDKINGCESSDKYCIYKIYR